MYRFLYKFLLFVFLSTLSPLSAGEGVPSRDPPGEKWIGRHQVRVEVRKDKKRDHRDRRGRRDRRYPYYYYHRQHPSHRYYRYHRDYRHHQPYYHDYYNSGYTLVSISHIEDVQKSDGKRRIRLSNGMIFQFQGSGPPLYEGLRVKVYRTARGGVGFSFGIGSGPFRFYYRDAKGRNIRYYLGVGDYLYQVDRLE